MRTSDHNLITLTLVLTAASMVTPVLAGDRLKREHQVKAAFVYNFIKFVDWPKEKMADPNEPMIIGIIGSRDFTKAFEPVKDKRIKNRKISIRYFEGFEKLSKSRTGDGRNWKRKMEMLRRCHVLLLCTCAVTQIESSSDIVAALAGAPVLTVGEEDGFLESGGIINFLTVEDRVRFEINAAAAKEGKLRISSKLLRLATRVLKEERS
jgi:hypothetical protein